jgi:glutathione synthase/RimK-type ligase-like ATP-grasp enzyme
MPLAASPILIVSDEFDPHVDQMLVMLRGLGIECLRWITTDFPAQSRLHLSANASGYTGVLETASWTADLTKVRSVWHRHYTPGEPPDTLSAEEQLFARQEMRSALAALQHAFDWFWVNNPDRTRIAQSKGLQLKIATELGFRIPRTLITNDAARVREFFHENGGEIIYKPFNSGFFAGTERVCYTTPLKLSDLDNLDLIRLTPGIFQENIRKSFELRITVVGRSVFATEIHSQALAESRNDWREVAADDLVHRPHMLPEQIERRCLELLDRLGLAYGAMDLILTPDGEYVFLENNPAGQFGWIEVKTGEPLTATLARMLIAGRVL